MTIGNYTLPTEIMKTCQDGFMYCFSKWTYDVTGGLFWTFMLLAFCIVLMIATVKLGYNRAFGFGSFTGMIGAIWLSTMKLMPWWTASIFILAGVIGIGIMVLSEK